MMRTLLEILGVVALVSGSIFTLLGILGMIRFPDVYTRLQATGKVSVLGAVMVLVAAIILTPLSLGKGLLLILLIILSAPVVTHAIASAAYRTGIPLEGSKVDYQPRDDLRTRLPKVYRYDPDLVMIDVDEGKLGLYHRPGRKMFTRLKKAGIDVVVTLLNETENARQIGNSVQNQGIEWVWIPIPDGSPPEGEVKDQIAEKLPELSSLLDQGKSILIHCSAGIHRTGMVALALLRWRGFSEEQALKLIAQMRMHTYSGMRAHQINWSSQFGSDQPESSQT